MKTIARCPMAPEEFDGLPESTQPFQLIEGQLVVAPSPDRFHQRLSGIIFAKIFLYLEDQPGLGEVYQAPFDVQLPGQNVFQPDVMFFGRDHLDRLTDRRAIGAPDLVVEILSPSTAGYDLNEKRLHYARSGVAELWIVDPERKHLRVYFPGQGIEMPVRVLKAGQVLTTDLLPGFKLPLNRLFR
ncbi:MAG TPA: Uma2 family endonuclease [Chthoniobacterales bacterium]